jgi:hypothetical protein
MLVMSPAWVRFGNCSLDDDKGASQMVAVRASAPLVKLLAGCNSDRGSVRVQPGQDPERDFILHVKPSASLPDGPFAFQVRLQGVTGQGELPAVNLSVDGWIVSDIQAEPKSVLFGARVVGQSAAETVLLQSRRGETTHVSSVEVKGAGLAVEAIGQDAQGAHAYRLTQAIAQQGNHMTEAVFQLRLSDERQITRSVTVHYFGIVRAAGIGEDGRGSVQPHSPAGQQPNADRGP